MAGRKHQRRTFTLNHPKGMRPEDCVRFVHLRSFDDAWEALGLTDEDLNALQIMIMAAPERGPVISGTGGLRKIRLAPGAWNIGKRGAIRVCYTYYRSYSVVLLGIAYDKSSKDDLTRGEKKEIKELLKTFGKQLDEGI